MTFQKGHKLATGRPKGSLNKLTKANREFLHSILFDEEQFIKDWMELDLNGRMELRTRLASYILPKATEENLFVDSGKSYPKEIYKSFGLEPPQNIEEGFDFRQFCSLLKAKQQQKELEK
jgi:hypothetical protein